MRADDLTPTQLRVLDLISEGKTNFEIGQALGLTLDGAKYHVSELLNKLGVDSREEAAAWWRSQQALARRLSGAMRSSVAKWSAVAAVGAGTVAALFLVWQAAMDDEPEPIPEIQAAFIQGFDPEGRMPQHIVVVDEQGNMRKIGPEGHYILAAWSPDARHLFAVRFEADPGAAAFYHIFDAAGGPHQSWRDDATMMGFEWSPDGQRLALLRDDRIEIRDLRGRKVAELLLPDRDRHSTSGSGLAWASDSRRVAGADGAILGVLSKDGSGEILDLPEDFVGDRVILVGWAAPSTLQVTAPQYIGRPVPDSLAWTRDVDRGGPWAVSAWSRPADFDQQRHDEARRFATEPDGVLVRPCKTADGRGVAYAFVTVQPPTPGTVSSLVVDHNGSLTKLAVPQSVSEITFRPCVSVVLKR